MGKEVQLEINQKVELHIKLGEFAGIYPSRIEEISDRVILLAAPIKKGRVLPVETGTPVEVCFARQNCFYCFASVVSGMVREKVPLVVVQKPEKIERVQRRRFVRFEVRLPVKFYLLDNQYNPLPPQLEGFTVNISGGGILLATEAEVKIGDQLQLEIAFPDGTIIEAVGRVVRLQEVWEDRKAINYAGIEFILLSSRDQDTITRFIFQQQRLLRAKGLL
ncbi:MAG: hypothetical protein PWQ91_1798 [Eubacteriales bacterium]|nr:hypothetical protein [Eubacteriales bacterium]MDN5364733.1 hypothetical protein [Eubacteriales bacterium]